jgi:hypothetical protein
MTDSTERAIQARNLLYDIARDNERRIRIPE